MPRWDDDVRGVVFGDEAGPGASGANVEGPFTLAHDTAGINTAGGATLFTPAVGDIITGFVVVIATPFDDGAAGEVNLLVGSFGGGNNEELDRFRVEPGNQGTDYSQEGSKLKVVLTATPLRAKLDVACVAGSLTLRVLTVPAA